MEKIVVGSHELPVISVAEETGYLDGVKRLGVVIRLGREAGFDHLKEMFSGRVTIEIFESVDGGSWEKVNELGGYELDHIGYDGKGYSVTLFRRSEITAMREQLQLLIPPEPTTLAGWQARKQGENKEALAEWLASHPLTWADGKRYGVTLEDQQEMALNLMQYQTAVAAGQEAVLEWHSTKSACTAWDPKEFSALSLAIAQYVYPSLRYQEQVKEAIYAAGTKEEVADVVINYGTAVGTV